MLKPGIAHFLVCCILQARRLFLYCLYLHNAFTSHFSLCNHVHLEGKDPSRQPLACNSEFVISGILNRKRGKKTQKWLLSYNHRLQTAQVNWVSVVWLDVFSIQCIFIQSCTRPSCRSLITAVCWCMLNRGLRVFTHNMTHIITFVRVAAEGGICDFPATEQQLFHEGKG